MKDNVYIYFSSATDVTGKTLAEKLDVSSGNKKPTTKKDLIIGWGTKTDNDMTVDAKTVLNHPNAIRANRDKFTTLQRMKDGGVPVADFYAVDDIIKQLKKTKKTVDLSNLIGRTRKHQGGKGFWLCLNPMMVSQAISEGADYFQKLIDNKDEYRLHIFDGKLLHAQKKIIRDNMSEAFKDQNLKKLEASAAKKGVVLNKDTTDFILDKMAKNVTTPDMIVRSNTRGWKFVDVTEKVSKSLVKEAIKALSVIGLDFGAVDCCVDTSGNIWILEVNSGPGLDGTPLEAYIAAFKDKIDHVVGKATTVSTKTKVGTKAALKERIALISEMIDHADEAEAISLKGVFSKMFG